MRWKEPRGGERKTFARFLWLPFTIKHETRWLEVAAFEAVFCDYAESWIPVRWLEQQPAATDQPLTGR